MTPYPAPMMLAMIVLAFSSMLNGGGVCCTIARSQEVQPVQQGEAVEVIMDDEGVAELDLVFAENAAIDEPALAVLAQYVRTECGLAHRACKLSDAQLERFKKLDDPAWMKEQLKQPAQRREGVNLMQGIARFLGGQAIGGQADVLREDDGRQAIKRAQKKVNEKIAEILDEEQQRIFEEEKSQRDAFRDEALANVLAVALDSEVYATNEQREALTKNLTKWAHGKSIYWQFYFQNQNYIPQVDIAILRKCLSREQSTVLSTMNAYNYEMDALQLQMNGMQEVVEFKDNFAGKDVDEDAGDE